MNNKSVLLIVHSYDYEDSLYHCKSFNEVQTYFIKKQLENRGYDCFVYPGMSWLGTKKLVKSIPANFHRIFPKQLLNSYRHVLFTGAIPLKICNIEILKWFKENTSGLVMQMNEYRRDRGADYTFFALPDRGNDRQIFVGPMFDEESLYPDQQYNTLYLHIDHHFPGKGDCSKTISKLIENLPKNKLFQKNWDSFKIVYHSRYIRDIESLDFYNKPKNIPFKDLSAIYRKTHIGFLSHYETLGLYPLELTACGSLVVVCDKSHLKDEIRDLLDVVVYTDNDADNFWNMVLPKISEKQAITRKELVLKFSYNKSINTIVEKLDNNNLESDY